MTHKTLFAWLALAVCCAASRATAQPRAVTQLSLEPRPSFVISESQLRPNDTRPLRSLLESRWPTLGTGALSRGLGRRAGTATALSPEERFGVYDAYGTYLGGPEYLEGVYASNETQVRRLTDVEEYATFGRQHPAGAVVLTWALRYRR
jgi:hypothetical protein